MRCAQWVPMFELLFYNTLFGPGLMWLWADQEVWLWFGYDQAPKWCCGIAPIKRCSYGSDTTKPPSEVVALRRSRGVAMVRIRPSPQVIIVSCAQGAPMFELCFCHRLSLVPLIVPENSNLRDINLLNRKFLNRILRASKLCGRHLSLEPDF